MNRKGLLLCLVLGLLVEGLFAQKTTFPDDPESFIAYVDEELKKTKRPESENTAKFFLLSGVAVP